MSSSALIKYKGALFLFLFGLFITGLLGHKIQRDNVTQVQAELQESLDFMEENVVAHMEMYQYGLMGVRGALFAVAESNLSRDVFYRYNLTRDIDNEFPGALGFGFIRRVPADKIAPFLAKAKADGRADFRVKELSPNAGERYVIEYIEPVARNFAALGLDIASEPNLYQTAYSAMQSGEVRLTGPITLVQPDGSGRRSFLMLLPLYRDITLPNSVAEREAQAFGWSYAPLIIDDVLADVGILDNDHFVLDIYDVTDPSAPERLFSNNALNAQGANAVIATVRVYGRDWQFDLTATPTFFENANLLSPLLVGILGSIAAFIMALLAGFMEANYNHKRGFTKQRDRLAALVESSADGIIALSLDGTVKSWNKAAEQLFGYTNEEAINKDITQLIIATPFRHEHSVQLKLVALGESLSSVHTLRYKKDGSSIDVSITLSPIYSDEGVVVAASKTVRDISAQKVAEAKVRELNESLEYQVFERTSEIASLNTLFENVLMAASDFAIIATDLEGNIQLFNRGAEHLLGYQAEDMVGKKTPLVFHSQKELTDRYASSFDQPNAGPIQDFQILLLMAHKNSEYQEWHYLHKDGHVIDVKLVLTQMLDAKGKISGYLFIAVDITEQKRKHIELLTTQRQLLSRTEQLMMVYYVAELGIWEWVLEDSSLIWNNKMFEFYEQPTSLNQSELNYSHWESRIHPEDRQLTATQLNDAVMGKGDFNTVFRLLLPSGQLRYIQGGAYIQRNAEGEALRVVGINRDITAQREFEFKLRESKNIADTANAAKSMFLANMSHEIRTPMNAVLGMLQLIRTTELSMQQNSYADKAQIAAQSLLKLIDDILDFSKIESDKLELEKYPFTTEDLLNELAAVLTPNLGNKNVELLFDIDPLLPDRFEGDRQRLQQVLINLANNAIKFTDHGEIIVKIERLQLQDTACLVGQTVNDANGTESLAVRYNTDGTIDTSFGTNGFFVYDEPGALFFWTVQTTSDGGYLFGYQSDSTLIKVNSAGSLDTNWGGDGSVKNTTYSTATSAGFSSNSDGSVYQLLNDPVNKKIIVSKYTATGTVDTNFGTSGVIELSPVYSGMLFTFSSSPVSFNGNDVFAITSTGYLDGSFILKNELVKINLTSGNVDTSFGVNGYADLSNVGFNQYKEIIIDANGKVNVIGNKNAGGDADYQLVRLNANGLMDTTFGASGKVTTDLDSRNNYAWGADIDASGSIFVAGNRYQADGNNDFVLAKYNSDGSLNSSFKSAVAYTENGTPSVIFTSLTISDVDNTVLSSATVTIDTGFTVGDVLSFVNDNATMGNVTASYNTANGILTLTSAGATATLAQWQSALRAVTYASSSDTPTSVSSSRKMSIAVSDGQSVSNTLQETVAITAVNDVPTITNTPADLTVIENSASNIDLSSIVFVDADNSSATVTLTASSGSLSAASGSGSLTIVNTNSGELTISGGLSDINSYLDTTSNIKYTGAVGVSGDNAATLTIKANDGVVDSSASIINLDITDTTAPNATSTPDLATASDSGVSNVDNITNDTTPTLTGTSEANASVKLYDTDGTTLLGTTTADGSGNWSITSSALSTGSHTLTTKATDAAGNVSVASSGLTITVDDTAPTLSSSNPADEAVSVAPSGDITLTFSEDIAKGYDEITLINVTTGATVETFDVLNGSNLTYTGNTVTLNPTANLDEATTYAIRVDGNAVRDTAGNTYAGISDNTTLNFTTGVTDGAAPTFLSIQRADDNTITGSTTSFTLAFNEAVNAVAGDFELNAGGSVAGTIGSITGSGTNTITVNVTGISGIGTLGLNLKSGHAVTDLAGNALATAEPADDEVYTVDTVAPTLISINRVDSEMTNADSVQFMAVFSENVTGLSADDFELTGTATSGASIASVTGTGNGLVITVNGASGDGSLGVQLKSAATVTDTAGTALTATTASAVTERYTIDNTAPTATAIITTNTALSTADTVTFDVTFDGSVTNVNADDFEISGDVTGTVTSVTGSGSSYTVTVGSITGDGALGLNFKSSQNITDTSGNSFAGTEPSTDESYTIDNTLPTVASISRGMVNQVKAGTATDVVFTVVFSETVSGVASSDFAVTGNATNTGVSSVSSTDGKVFKVTVAGVNGTIGQTLGLSFTGSADDALSQASTATFTAGDTYTIAGTLLNEGALTQTQLDAIEDLNRVGTLLEQSVADATQVVIVDSRVPGLVDLTKQANPNADIWLLDGSRSAVEQITEILANYSDLEALHILSHGGVGEVYLGAETLSESSITENSGVYAAWGNALSENGDILLYGCNVAQGDAGLDFINQLAQVTGADIAASDDLTGSAMLGGDWVLEVKNGEVEDGSLLDIALFETYDRTLETVNFSGLGASDSGGPGFKVVTDNRFIVSNNLTLDGTVAYPSTSAAGQTFIFKADGTDAKTFTVDDMKISSFVNQAYSKGATVTFKGINGGVIETLTLANGKTLNTTSVSIFSWFESSFSSVQGVASIEYYLPDKTQNFQFDNFNLSEFANSDITAPVFESSTPSVSNIADITLDLTADINEAGKVYYIVVADGAQAPTAAQVKAGVSYGDINGRGAAVITSGSATVSSGAFSNTFNVTGLTASTSYDIYVVAEDDEGTPNLQSAVTKVDATTIAPVNQAPTLSGAAASQAVNDAATMSPFGAITLADVDNDNVSVTVALDTAAKGVFTAASLTTSGFTDAGSGSYTLSSTTLASAQAALRALVFDPADNRVTVGSTETTTFTITVNDGTVNGTNNATTVISTSINNTPTDMALSDASYNHSEGASNVVVGSFSTTDADTGESFSYSLVTGAGDTNNGLFNINGADLRITERADVPAGTYSVRVQVSDGDATYEKAFSITVTDDVAPTISSVVPVDDATGVSVADSIQITFDEDVQLGSSGTITLYDITGSGANSVTIDVTSHASQLSIAGNVLTIDPTSNLIATNQYAVQFTAGVLKDDTGNAITAVNDTTSYNFTTGTVDTSAPTVAIVDVADPTQPNAGTITINFSEQVANVDISDFTLTKDDTSVDISGLSVTGTGSTYTIDLSSVTAAGGTYVLTLATSNITDTSGNVLSAGDSESFVIDTTASTGVAIVRAGAETINGSAATFTAVFSEAVSGVDAADFTLTGTATGGTVSSVTQVSDSVYTVSVTGLTSDGTLGVDLNSTGTGITDTAGNAISGGKVGQQIIRDTTGPSVVAINRDGAALTTADTATFTVSFNEAVTGVDVSDFSLTAGATGNISSVTGSGSTYQVTVNSIEGNGALRLDLKASGTGITDTAGNAISAGFTSGDTLTIDNTAAVVTGSQSVTLDEGMASGTIIGQVKATDSNGISEFSIQSGNEAGYFTIDNNGVLALTSAGALAIDHETLSTYTLVIVAKDAIGQASSAVDVTISINDVNDNVPVFSSLETASINENSALTVVVYDANATDADSSSVHNTLTYSLKATGDHSVFTIDSSTGEVKLNAVADYETKASYGFTVIATDGMRSTEKAVTLSITDLNDNTPVITSGTTGSVNENAATSTVIYTATGTDADGTATNNTLRYSLTGTDAALLNINATTGAVTLKASADYETKDSYSFNVVATDNGAGNYNSGSLNIDKAVTVSVNDLNDNTPVITSGTTGSVNENAATSTVIYTATGTDADGTATNNTLRYSLTGTDAALLNINATTGAVTLKASADYETKDSYSFNVVATDNGAGNYNSGSLNIDKAVTVSINNLNDNAPTVSASSASAVIIEAGGVKNAVFSTNTATMILTKGDADGFVVYDTAYLASNGWVTADSGATYSKVGVYGAATFTLSTGQVSYALNNDIDATQTLTFGQIVTDRFVVQVTDNLVTDTVDAVFNITGANDAPTVSASLVAMTGTSGQVFVPVTLPADLFADVDANEVNTLVWSMENLPTGLVFNPVARTLSGTPQGGFEGINALNVVATDAQGAQVKAPVTLTLRPAPAISSSDAPVAPSQQVAITETPLLASLPDLPNNNNGLPAGTVETVSGEVSGFGTDSNSAPTAAEAPLVQPAAAVPNGNIIAESRVVVNVGANGQVQVSDAQAGVANITDLSVASLSVLPDRVSISIIDAKPGGSYSATLADGTGLPSWVEVNPTTGQVTLTPPQGQGSISLKINAVDADGNIRVLEVEVDLDNLPPALDIENNAPSVTMNRGEVFVPLSEQLAQAGEQYDDYGSDLMTLLVS